MPRPDPKHTNRELASGALKYLLGRLKGPRAFLMLTAFAVMMLAGWLFNQPAVLIGGVVNDLIEAETVLETAAPEGTAPVSPDFGDVLPVLLLVGLCLLGREIMEWLRKFIVETVGTRVEQEEFVRVISRLLTVDLAVMVREKIGALHTRIQRSIEGIVKLVKLMFLDFFPRIIVAVWAVAIAASTDSTVGFIMVGVFILGSFVTWCQVSSQKGIRLAIFGAKEAIGAKVNELLNGIGFVRASGLVKTEVGTSSDLAEDVRATEMRHHKWMMTFDAMKQLIESGGLLAVVTYSVWQAIEGNLRAGDVLTLMVLYQNAAVPMRELHRIVDEGYECIMKVRELAQLTALPRDIGLSGIAIPAEQVAHIEARDLVVRLAGPEGRETAALRGVTAEIPDGQVVGIAGPSGSGKSTFANTLLGLISDYEGSAKIAGVELLDWDKEALARMVGYVPQSPFLLAGTIRKNITYGVNSHPRTDDDIWKALSAAQIADRVRELPDTLDAQVSEAGRNLSGGEKQRLALARLFLRDSRIIVLDEATSALDSTNEAKIQEAMVELARGRTTLIIAHRLSTLRDADRVLVFDHGTIVQDGTYQELVAEEGMFRDLVRKQEHQFAAESQETEDNE